MKRSDIYQFYYLGIARHLSALIGSNSIAYDRNKHRYLIPDNLTFSNVMHVGLDSLSVKLKDELKVQGKAVQGYEWFFRLMTDVGQNSYLARLLLTGFNPYINSPWIVYYIAMCITKYEVCTAGSMIFSSPKVRFNNVLKQLNSLVDEPLSAEALRCLSALFASNYLVEQIPSKQKVLKSDKGELLWFAESEQVDLSAFKSKFLESAAFRPWAVELLANIGTDMDRNEYTLSAYSFIHDQILESSSDGCFDYWGVCVVPMGVQHFLLSATHFLKPHLKAVPVQFSTRNKELDLSPILDAEKQFFDKAKEVFGEVT